MLARLPRTARGAPLLCGAASVAYGGAGNRTPVLGSTKAVRLGYCGGGWRSPVTLIRKRSSGAGSGFMTMWRA